MRGRLKGCSPDQVKGFDFQTVQDTQTTYKKLLTDQAKTNLDMYFITHPLEQDRPVVSMGYSGGLMPLIEAVSSSVYNVKTIVGLGAATAYIKREWIPVLHQLLTAVINKSVDLAQGTLQKLGFVGSAISDFVEGIQNYYYDKVMPIIKEAFHKTMERIDSTTFSPIRNSKTDLIVNVWGTKDVLYECDIAGKRDNFCGKTTYNIEIVGATHFDYMERDTNDKGNPPDAWNIEVSQFVADLIINSKDEYTFQHFLDERKYIKYENGVYVVRLQDYEAHQ